MSKKVLVGMSGGVDSTVCAHLLLKEGYDILGVNCSFFDKEKLFPESYEPNENGTKDAKATAEKLGIDFEVLDFSEEFEKRVISNFIETYRNGGTPNPCIECNKFLKFGKMLESAEEKGCGFIATGHYAQIEYSKETGRYLLKKGADLSKDQSYVLYMLTQHQLSHTLFPLGKMLKTDIRDLAQSLGLINANKSDSQDICFVPDGDYASFIERMTKSTFPHGNFVDTEGKILGTHKGIIRYTIGQRRGLGLALPAPMYVFGKDIKENKVILSSEPMLYSKHLDAKDINFIPFDKADAPFRVKARTRYKQTEQWATVTQTDEDRFHVEFDEPQRAISKGQSVVLYDGDYVVGGGTII